MGVNRWKKQSLKELCTRVGDGLHGTPKYSNTSTIPFINGNNLKNGKIIVTENTNYVSDEEYDKNFIELNKNSLLLSINGTLGSMAFYNDEKIMLGKSAAYLNFKTDINKFHYYYFQLPSIQNYFYNVATGSTIKNLSLKSIQDFKVPVPEIIEYKQIVKILSDLDAKIEVNNKINHELEAMAKTLYDYWFVQFDFPAHLSGTLRGVEGYKSSGGKMIFNEELKREIPAGWEDGVLSDISDIIMGQSPAGSSYNEEGKGTVFYQGSTDFGSRFPTVRKYTTEPSRMAQENDILLSVRAPVGTLNQAMEDCCIGRGLAALREKEGSISFLWSQMEYFKQIFDRRNSSGTTFGSITKDDLFSLKLCLPEKQVLESFKRIADPLHDKIVVNSKENEKLSELRDWLLPMLMNGQISVGEPEERLGMVAEERGKYNSN